MAEMTGISWADSTANLWIGCQKESPACDFCYAEAEQAIRRGRVQWGPDGDRDYCRQGWLDVRRWNRQAERNGGIDPKLGRKRRVFINSLSDFFDNHRSVVWRPAAWKLIRDCPNIIFMLVTKRPKLIARSLPPFWDEIASRVWLITTAENQEWLERRAFPLAAACSGRAQPAVLGLSIEPMLGGIDLTSVAFKNDRINLLTGRRNRDGQKFLRQPFRWVICGGESGLRARPLRQEWVRFLYSQCDAFGVPFHFKQWGEWMPTRLIEGEGDRFDSVFMDGSGRFASDYPGKQWMHAHETDFYRVGKSDAGRLLEAHEYLGVPLT